MCLSLPVPEMGSDYVKTENRVESINPHGQLTKAKVKRSRQASSEVLDVGQFLIIFQFKWISASEN